jgi:hypothetical protein
MIAGKFRGGRLADFIEIATHFRADQDPCSIPLKPDEKHGHHTFTSLGKRLYPYVAIIYGRETSQPIT